MVCTLLTDFGTKDFYVAALKASLLKVSPTLTIVDISHQIEPDDFFSAGFQARAVCFEFEADSLHFIAVGTSLQFWYIYCQNQHFVSNSTEVLHLITKDKQIDNVAVISLPAILIPSFACKDFFCSFLTYFCNRLPNDSMGDTLAKPSIPFESTNFILSPRVTQFRDGFRGHILYIDHFGNLVTNFSREYISQSKFSLNVGIETITKLSEGYHSKSPGEIVAFFNSLNLLEIAVVSGNASQLLGMRRGTELTVVFP